MYLHGLCAFNIFSYEMSLSCWTFRKHDREPLFGHGNTFGRGRPVCRTFIFWLVDIRPLLEPGAQSILVYGREGDWMYINNRLIRNPHNVLHTSAAKKV
jgi:hypothetical protein